MKPECLWNVQFVKIQQNDEQSWKKKKHTSMSKKLIFVQTYTKFVVVMTKSKVMDAVDISKIYANDKWTATENFQPLRVNCLSKTSKKPWIAWFNKIINKFNWFKVSQSFDYIE